MWPRTSLTLIIVATLGACSGDDTAAQGDQADLIQRFQTARDRTVACAEQPWLVPLQSVRRPLDELVIRMRQLGDEFDGSVSEERTSAMEALLRQFSALEPLVTVVEHVTPLTNRVFSAEQAMITILGRMKIPDDAPFPLRSTLQEGWLPDRANHITFLISGLEALANGKTDDKLRVSVGNLERLATEGEELMQQINLLARKINIMQVKVFALPRRAEWGRRVLKAAAEQGGIEAAVIRSITSAVEAGEAAVPVIADQWGALKLRAIRDPQGTEAAVKALMESADKHLLAISEAAQTSALKLRVVGSRH